jgi:hypothetical protein
VVRRHEYDAVLRRATQQALNAVNLQSTFVQRGACGAGHHAGLSSIWRSVGDHGTVRVVAHRDKTERKDVDVARAASLWNVNPKAVYKWIKEGRRVDFFDTASGSYLAPEARVRSAKVIRRNDLFTEPFKVPRAALGDAERDDRIRPSRDGRFSLDDVDMLRAIARGEPTVPVPKAFTAAESGQPQGADTPTEPDDLVFYLAGDQGEDGENSNGEREDENGKDESSKDKDKGENGTDPVQVHPRRAELDRVIEEARRGHPAPYWYYYTDDEIANGDAVYPPTTPISAWWKTPPEVLAAVPEGHTLRAWYPGCVAFVEKDIILMDLYGSAPGDHARRWLKGRVTPKQWAGYACFEPGEGLYIFYAIYRDAAHPRDDVVRILAQPEPSSGA